MNNIPERVEKLARAMCEAVDIDPDETFGHGAEYSPIPKMRVQEGFIPAVAVYSPMWVTFAWEAQKLIYSISGGKLPENEESGDANPN